MYRYALWYYSLLIFQNLITSYTWWNNIMYFSYHDIIFIITRYIYIYIYIYSDISFHLKKRIHSVVYLFLTMWYFTTFINMICLIFESSCWGSRRNKIFWFLNVYLIIVMSVKKEAGFQRTQLWHDASWVENLPQSLIFFGYWIAYIHSQNKNHKKGRNIYPFARKKINFF